ncbi:hypothetical protein BJ508DRAFT_315600 [Ascobolus immersus RN42]|uniref:Uncharacterized protein n=1 Tax=Ascobolus immersus RN42 TaxID=1160509 RepID=A0A3N4HGF6_ASCIM|nr:hypothetical protein BJ508DRAFT_315600 [Ascobolus immersus RN42]
MGCTPSHDNTGSTLCTFPSFTTSHSLRHDEQSNKHASLLDRTLDADTSTFSCPLGSAILRIVVYVFLRFRQRLWEGFSFTSANKREHFGVHSGLQERRFRRSLGKLFGAGSGFHFALKTRSDEFPQHSFPHGRRFLSAFAASKTRISFGVLVRCLTTISATKNDSTDVRKAHFGEEVTSDRTIAFIIEFHSEEPQAGDSMRPHLTDFHPPRSEKKARNIQDFQNNYNLPRPLMALFADIPNELKLEIAYQTADWETFTAFRQADRTNFSLLSNYFCIRQWASRLSSQQRLDPRNTLVTRFLSGISNEAICFLSQLFTGSVATASSSAPKRRSTRLRNASTEQDSESKQHQNVTPSTKDVNVDFTDSRNLEIFMKLTNWKSWTGVATIQSSTSAATKFPLPSDKERFRYVYGAWGSGGASPTGNLMMMRTRDPTIDVHNFRIESGVQRLHQKCVFQIFGCGRRPPIHEPACPLSKPKRQVRETRYWKRIRMLLGIWYEDAVGPQRDWDTFGELKGHFNEVKTTLLEIQHCSSGLPK